MNTKVKIESVELFGKITYHVWVAIFDGNFQLAFSTHSVREARIFALNI